LISITSRTVRPKVGVPQISTLSFVWKGPNTSSLSVNWISVQPMPARPAR
jgi:hypothetical protein